MALEGLGGLWELDRPITLVSSFSGDKDECNDAVDGRWSCSETVMATTHSYRSRLTGEDDKTCNGSVRDKVTPNPVVAAVAAVVVGRAEGRREGSL
jgi:hypothetical protein